MTGGGAGGARGSEAHQWGLVSSSGADPRAADPFASSPRPVRARDVMLARGWSASHQVDQVTSWSASWSIRGNLLVASQGRSVSASPWASASPVPAAVRRYGTSSLSKRMTPYPVLPYLPVSASVDSERRARLGARCDGSRAPGRGRPSEAATYEPGNGPRPRWRASAGLGAPCALHRSRIGCCRQFTLGPRRTMPCVEFTHFW